MPSLILFILTLLALAAWATWLARASLFAAQIYQIEEYEAPRLVAWGRRPQWQRPRAVLIASAIVALLGLYAVVFVATPSNLLSDGGNRLVAIALLIGAIELNLLWRRPPAKKPIAYTPRMRRILGGAAASAALLVILAATLLTIGPTWLAALTSLALCAAAPWLALRLPVVGNWLIQPIERRIQQGFVDQAKAKISLINPLVVGIAGSYGKTSTKQIAGQLLATQRNTLPTPKSFNTLMGVTRTINEYLKPEHKLFLVEMDAYGAGEIAAMCELVQPQHAIITSVGPQHLERFGTVAAIGAAIYELVAALPSNGVAMIYCGDDETAALAQRAAAAGRKVVRYGYAEPTNRQLDLFIDDLTMNGDGSRFRVCWPAEGLDLWVHIPLLSRHNALNTAAALGLAHLLGIDPASLVPAATQLEYVANRLQVIRGAGGVTVIDDSYNANPVGVHNALEVLTQIEARQRILVTPGMVELGSVEEAENRRYGEHAARVCDHVILVGRAQTAPIQAGLQAAGMASERIHIVQTLDEVTTLIGRLAAAGDVVLFANDLPDNYLE